MDEKLEKTIQVGQRVEVIGKSKFDSFLSFTFFNRKFSLLCKYKYLT